VKQEPQSIAAEFKKSLPQSNLIDEFELFEKEFNYIQDRNEKRSNKK